MYALALLLALAAPAAALAAPAPTPVPADRTGYEREIEAYQVPKLLDYVLNEEYLLKQRNRGKLITRVRPEEAVASDNVILESNIVKILKPRKLGGELVRQRRGYNLENVVVPARYPYLPVPRYYNRFRKWG
ncbi:uncharacterized protein LOC121739457 [Aricia agestis]|uniref:uncharacterized protein LOC121739457 n=1 Tax=Aricia agestis TaxID=91739 RepID=UPI001C202738|nr:uncharacterized protein LOC121739457 [Aricia agestis]